MTNLSLRHFAVTDYLYLSALKISVAMTYFQKKKKKTINFNLIAI